jgi:hypothetical protein
MLQGVVVQSYQSLGIVWAEDLDMTGSEFLPSQFLADKAEEKKDCFVPRANLRTL